MTRPQFAPRGGTHRAKAILDVVTRAYPDAWAQVDQFRAMRGKDLPAWPAWCYLPLHGAEAIVSGALDPGPPPRQVPLACAHHIGIIGALAAWRVSQGIYRYDETLATALRETPMPTDLPASALYRLPEWCVYLETPGYRWLDRDVAGAWVHMEWDERGADELRVLLDTALTPETALDAHAGLIALPIILGTGGIVEALQRVIASGTMRVAAAGLDVRHAPTPMVAATDLWPLISMVLYLCADDPDLGGRTPTRPTPTRTKRGYRLFPADRVTTWDVGVRIGAAIRRAIAEAEPGSGDASHAHARPRAHVRRAHWHTFLAGPRDQQDRERRIKWLPPIPVNIDALDDLPATIHPVERTDDDD